MYLLFITIVHHLHFQELAYSITSGNGNWEWSSRPAHTVRNRGSNFLWWQFKRNSLYLRFVLWRFIFQNNNGNELDAQRSYSTTALRCTCSMPSLIKNDKNGEKCLWSHRHVLLPYSSLCESGAISPWTADLRKTSVLLLHFPQEQISGEAELHQPKAICVPEVFRNAQPEEASLTFDCTLSSWRALLGPFKANHCSSSLTLN